MGRVTGFGIGRWPIHRIVIIGFDKNKLWGLCWPRAAWSVHRPWVARYVVWSVRYSSIWIVIHGVSLGWHVGCLAASVVRIRRLIKKQITMVIRKQKGFAKWSNFLQCHNKHGALFKVNSTHPFSLIEWLSKGVSRSFGWWKVVAGITSHNIGRIIGTWSSVGIRMVAW